MPTSDAENKDVVVKWFDQIGPKNIIDIGAGEGTYARLIKDFSSTYHGFWTAIEAWGPYASEYKLIELYDNIIIADACYVDYRKIHNGHSDLVIAGDVLEHMTKDESKALIKELMEHTDNLIISIPLVHLDQDAYKGNWFETHLDHWHFEEMKLELGNGLYKSVEGPTLGYFWWRKI